MSVREREAGAAEAAMVSRKPSSGPAMILSRWRRRVPGAVALGAVLIVVALTLAGCATTAAQDPASAGVIPPDAARDFNSGQTQQGNGHCDRAIPLYLRAIQENGMYVNAYVSLGDCDQALGSFNGAIVEYDKAIQIDPMRFDLYLHRAGAETNNGSTGAATVDALTALRLAPHQALSYESVANSFLSFNDYADAVMAMDRAIALVPDDPSLYTMRAGIYLQAHDYGRAYADYQRALAVAPYTASKAGIYASLATVYDGQGNFPSAYNAMNYAIALQPGNAHFYVQDGDIHRDGSQFTAALGLYDHALRLVSRGSDAEAAHEGKGDALVSLGRPQQAIAEYRTALGLTTDPGVRARLKAEIKAAQSGSS